MRTFAFLLTFAILSAKADVVSVNDLAAKYRRASSEKERMNICIEAIDLGLLYQGCSVKVLDGIFGSKLVEEIPKSGEPREKSAIDFADQPKPVSNEIQTPLVGWYLAVEFDDRGVVHHYYLSNLHK